MKNQLLNKLCTYVNAEISISVFKKQDVFHFSKKICINFINVVISKSWILSVLLLEKLFYNELCLNKKYSFEEHVLFVK